MDILLDCYQRKLLSFEECDSFIKNVIANGSKLPFKGFKSYLDSIQQAD